MAKVQRPIDNNFCPQPVYLFGTYQEDGAPHFGQFTWLGFNWIDGENGPTLGAMVCIGEEKVTKDLIRRNGVFSANLVPERLLSLSDYYGSVSGREHPEKMKHLPTVEPGQVLTVPTIADCPVSFELRVLREEHLSQGSDLFLCEICNVTVEENLQDESVPFMERIAKVSPVLAYGAEYYGTVDGRNLGKWGEPMNSLPR